MAGLKETKRRIGSVKNTQKITRAMKLVSSAKYARANHAVLNARPYGEAFDQMVSRLASDSQGANPLLEERKEKKVLLIVVATDRGLCGGLNGNLIKTCQQHLDKWKDLNVEVDVIAWGRRAEVVCRGRDEKMIEKEEKVLDKPSYDFALKSVQKFCEWFEEGAYDRVEIAFSVFKNAMTQIPTIESILPVPLSEDCGDDQDLDLILEPDRNTLLSGLLLKKISGRVFRIFLEGSASEHAARMTAMDSATNNADQVIRSLTLQYNRARQAAITKELIEITSGAEAL